MPNRFLRTLDKNSKFNLNSIFKRLKNLNPRKIKNLRKMNSSKLKAWVGKVCRLFWRWLRFHLNFIKVSISTRLTIYSTTISSPKSPHPPLAKGPGVGEALASFPRGRPAFAEAAPRRQAEFAPTHQEKVKCSFIYAKLINTSALNALRLTPHPLPLPLKGRGER
jgi:hypothetical protein